MKKKILITGSTDGIGKLTAMMLAKENHQVYLHGRSIDKLNNTIEEIKETSKNSEVSGFIADFVDLKQVKQMASKIKSVTTSLDVLINNAGVYKSDGNSRFEFVDQRIMVNYYAPYLLTNEIIQLLENSNSPRIINLSSAAQEAFNFDAIAEHKKMSIHEAYAQSKLAITMWSFYLAKNKPKISTIAVNPGSLLNTKMVRRGFNQVWSEANKGAEILFDLTISPQYDNITGKYFDNDKGSFGQAHPFAYDQKNITDLITFTDKAINKNIF